LVLGFATGSTMVGVYKHLVGLHKQGSLNFSRVVTFNLDEYLGLSAGHPQSFHHFMHKHLFAHVNLNPRNIHIPDGTIRGNYEQYCASYEETVVKPAESTSSFWALDAMATSALTSRLPASAPHAPESSEPGNADDNSKFFAPVKKVRVVHHHGHWHDPGGAESSLACRRRLQISGCRQVHRRTNHLCCLGFRPSTSSDVTFIIDDAAASQLTQRDYYHRVLQMTALLTPDRLS